MELDDDLLSQTGASWDRPECFTLRKVPKAARLALFKRGAEVLCPLEQQHSWLVKAPRLCVTLTYNTNKLSK